ncbi:MAG: hypothetical protein GWO87_02245, partial [Xanthomonadaceae bacterium]|nr:hypothetical protein [Rhodospirillaceae bacterium]NIA17988.1 hypothetical protein [Xanthomonadaceae bacterium]
ALSLGGGGAKTFAHLGVIDALLENKIPINFLTTCSAASIIGVLTNIKIDSCEIKNEFNKRKWLRLIKRSIFKEVLKKYLKKKNITNINQGKVPISIVTVDLKTGKEVVFEEGDPLLIPLASSAFPGIWKPIKYRDYYLVDGGILNLDPANIAREKVGSRGIVISVTLQLEFEKEKPGGRLDTVLKSLYLSPFKYRNEILKNNSDIIISPANDLKISFRDWKETFFGYFSNNKIEKFYQKGYEAAIKEIPKIKKLIKNL